METDIVQSQCTEGNAGENVFAGMILHPVVADIPIKYAFDG